MKKIVIYTIHGMGDTKPDYANVIKEELIDRIGKATWSNDVHFSPIYYQNTLQVNQDKVWGRTRKNVDWKKLRKFLLFGFSDAASLESKKHASSSKYSQVQNIILNAFIDAFNQINNPTAPVVVIAQSLGGQVISNYLWDATRTNRAKVGIWQKQPVNVPAGSALNRFARGKTIKRFYTTGCNIPIFVSGHNVIKPIPKLNNEFQWHNYYDEDDVLGWPLKPLSPEYRALVHDHEINVGGFFRSWNPLSHSEYWEDKDFLKPVTKFIKSIL